MKMVLTVILIVMVSFAVPRNKPVLPPVSWNGYGDVDWCYRSLRIGTAHKDSLLEDGWIFGDSLSMTYAFLGEIDVDTLTAARMSVDTLEVPGYVSTGYLVADSSVTSPQVKFSYSWPADTLIDKTAEVSTGAGAWGIGHGVGFRINKPSVIESVTAFGYTGFTAADVYWSLWAAFSETFGGTYAGQAPDGTFDYWDTGVVSDTLNLPSMSDSLSLTWTFDPPVVLSPGVYFLAGNSMGDFTLDEAAHSAGFPVVWGYYSTGMSLPTATGMDYRVFVECSEVDEVFDFGFLLQNKGISAVSLVDGYSWLRANFFDARYAFLENIRSSSGSEINVRSPMVFNQQLYTTGGRPGMSDTLVTAGNDTLFVNFGLVTGFVPGP